jgi:acetyl esterase/lipase
MECEMRKRVFRGIIILLAIHILSSLVWAGAEQAEEKIVPKPAPVIQMMEVPSGIQVERDVVYADVDGHKLKLDIAYPKANQGKIPAILNFHGGGWLMGDKNPNEAIIEAQHGFVGISIQYRKTDVAKFPAAVHDCKTAVRWARANAKKYGIDPARIAVMGGSAGGYLAAIVGVSNGVPYLEGDGPYKEYSSSVQAAIDQFGPIDFARMNDVPGTMNHNLASGPESQFIGKPVQEAPDLVKKANPITYVDANDPPILIMHGEKDLDVIIQQSELFYEALIKSGVKTRFVRVQNAGHGFTPVPEGAIISPSKEEIEKIQWEWLKEVFRMNK